MSHRLRTSVQDHHLPFSRGYLLGSNSSTDPCPTWHPTNMKLQSLPGPHVAKYTGAILASDVSRDPAVTSPILTASTPTPRFCGWSQFRAQPITHHLELLSSPQCPLPKPPPGLSAIPVTTLGCLGLSLRTAHLSMFNRRKIQGASAQQS